jgi:type IV secretory pathway TrbD component
LLREEKMNEQIKAALESYLRNLLGVVLALVTTTMANSGVASPLDFGAGEWLTVANGLWAAAVPTLLRWVNKKDPAFGLVATVVASEVSKKLDDAVKEEVKKAPAKKAPAKKPAVKK